MNEKNAILTQDLTKRFGEILAVDKMNLEIPFGTIYGLLGPNGAGKTTSVRILNGIIKSTSGKAIVGGYDLETHAKQVKMMCGFLPETPGLYQKLTPREYLQFIGELYYIPREIIESRIRELLEMFDLKERKDDLLENLSQGMKQKVCICAALIQDPEIIFLDEPTSNLDPGATRMVKDLLSDLTKRAEKTIFICTHLLDTAKELCDIIGIIDKGKLKVEGSPQKIMNSVGAHNLEEAYLKIVGPTHTNDLLAWRQEQTHHKKIEKEPLSEEI